MIHPVSIIKLLNERKYFVNNHPEFIDFILKTFGGEMLKGDRIKVMIEKENGEKEEICISLEESDMQMVGELKKVVEQIRS